MRETDNLCERPSRGDGMKKMGMALHDLCQPLTTLQCRLEMAELIDTADGYRAAVKTGMAECLRLSAAVALMRSAVRAAMQQAAGGDRGPGDIGAAG